MQLEAGFPVISVGEKDRRIKMITDAEGLKCRDYVD